MNFIFRFSYNLLSDLFLGFSKNVKLIQFQLFLAIQSIFISVYLAYILFFKLEDVCVVCVSMYILNIANFVLINKKLNRLIKTEEPIQVKEKEN